ncbi:MAG: histidine kinase [Xanthomarina sp.]
MIKTITLIVSYFLLGLINLHGQIIVDSIFYKSDLIHNENVKIFRTDVQTSLQEISKETAWKSFDSAYKPTRDTAIWLKFEIENKSKDTLVIYLYNNEHFTRIYQQQNQDFLEFNNGLYVPHSQRANQSEDFFTKLILTPFQKSLIYVKSHANNITSHQHIPSIYSESAYWEYSKSNYKKQEKSIGFIYFYIISLTTILIFALVFWLRLRESLYLYYFGYLFFQLTYGFLVLRNTLAPVANFFNHIPKLAFKLFEPIQFIFIGFYVLFILKLLHVKIYDKKLAKTLQYLAIFCFIYAITRFVFSYLFIDTKFVNNLFIIVRSIILPLNFLLIFWIIFKVKHPLLIYFIVGQTFFFVGALLSTYIGYSYSNMTHFQFLRFKESANILFQLGLLAEVYCFSLALAKNVVLLQKKKEKSDAKLIFQLQKNQQIQETMNQELDEKVNNKTYELIQLYSEIERERELKIKDDFTKRIKETEMMALRSQMNPHFIFNSMNAIKYLIMTSRNEDAINYLDDFSSLLRGILQNSNRDKITVEEELEILELYLSLEQNRMGKEFNFTIETTSKEALSQYQIPPMLLQPIVENAIWHGLQPSLKAEKNLKVILDTTEGLVITIEDNGIGRKESAKKKKLHQSLGASIVQDRLTLYNHLNDHAIYLKTKDLEDENGVLGTRITLTYEY